MPAAARSSSTRSNPARRRSRSSCCACSRPAGRAPRHQRAPQARPPGGRGDQGRSRRPRRARRLPRGPLLPPQRRHPAHPAAARAARGRAAALRALPPPRPPSASAARCPEIGSEVRDHLRRHDWPGNVRELLHFADRVVLGLVEDEEAVAAAPAEPEEGTLPERVDRFEAGQIRAALRGARRQCRGGDGGARAAEEDLLRQAQAPRHPAGGVRRPGAPPTHAARCQSCVTPAPG